MTTDRTVRIAVLFPSTGLIDGEICDLAEERGAEALIYKVAPATAADSADAAAVASMTQEMGSPELLARVAAQAREVDPDVVVWACTSGSFLGPGIRTASQSEAMSQALGGIPATTTSAAMLASLSRRRIRHVAVVTPYHAAIGRRFVTFLEQNGFTVDGEAHAGCGSDAQVGALTSADLLPLARSAVRPASEALVIPCTALRRRDIETVIGSALGLPVVLANGATLDHAVALALEESEARER